MSASNSAFANMMYASYDAGSHTLRVHGQVVGEDAPLSASDFPSLEINGQVSQPKLEPAKVKAGEAGQLSYSVPVDAGADSITIKWGDATTSFDLPVVRDESSEEVPMESGMDVGDVESLSARLQSVLSRIAFEGRLSQYTDGGLYSTDLDVATHDGKVYVEGSIKNNDDTDVLDVVVGYALVDGEGTSAKVVATGSLLIDAIKGGETKSVSVEVPDTSASSVTDSTRLVISDVVGW